MRVLSKASDLFRFKNGTKLKELIDFLNSDEITEADKECYVRVEWADAIIVRREGGMMVLYVENQQYPECDCECGG